MTGRQTPTFQVIPGEKGLAASDSRSQLRELYERYGASVFGRCSYILKDRNKAEDAMQDVFAKALTHLAGFRAEASPLTSSTSVAPLWSKRSTWAAPLDKIEQRVYHAGSRVRSDARQRSRTVS